MIAETITTIGLICSLWMVLGFILCSEERYTRMIELPVHKQLIVVTLTYSPLILVIGALLYVFVLLYEILRVKKFFDWLWEK